MRRVAKAAGKGNIFLEEVDVPLLAPTQVLVRAEYSLISRGSEIWRRYDREEAIDPRMMGYSLAGTIAEVGAEVEAFKVGDRVAALAPHAEYVAMEVIDPPHKPSVVHLPAEVSAEAGTFWPLATSSLLWMQETGAGSDDTMVIQGQGLVGSGCMQVAKALGVGTLIAVDALPLRCRLAAELGADATIDLSGGDGTEEVMRLTSGQGADVVVEAVGGRAGAAAFAQAQDMVRRGGLIQVLGLYESEPLPLDSAKIQGKRLLGGYLDAGKRPAGAQQALELLRAGHIQVEKMITHRFAYTEAKTAFDLLYEDLGKTMAVLLTWDD
jgi:L-iditol 2-dehydrogenase